VNQPTLSCAQRRLPRSVHLKLNLVTVKVSGDIILHTARSYLGLEWDPVTKYTVNGAINLGRSVRWYHSYQGFKVTVYSSLPRVSGYNINVSVLPYDGKYMIYSDPES